MPCNAVHFAEVLGLNLSLCINSHRADFPVDTLIESTRHWVHKDIASLGCVWVQTLPLQA